MAKYKPNCACDICSVKIYRRPSQLIKNNGRCYCSSKCFNSLRKLPESICIECGLKYTKIKSIQKCCSKSCAARYNRRMNFWSTHKKPNSIKNASNHRLIELYRTFEFKTCMVEGCLYDKCFDVHRFIPGNQGGQYEIGNMFAICPNHHAEFHRNIIFFKKINDQLLKAYIFIKQEPKLKTKKEYLCLDCSVKIDRKSIRCRNCYLVFKKINNKELKNKTRRKVERPTKEELFYLLWQTPTVKIAKKYNVSDVAVAKWAKSYNLNKPPRGYWAKQKNGE